MRWALELYVATSAEVTSLTLGQFQDQLFDERGNIIVGLYGAFPLLNAEYLFRNLNLKILLNRCLTGQSLAFVRLTTCEMALLCRK